MSSMFDWAAVVVFGTEALVAVVMILWQRRRR